jgi:hypothetical protein
LLKDYPHLYAEFRQFAPSYIDNHESSEEDERPVRKVKKHIDISPSHFEKSVTELLTGAVGKNEKAIMDRLQQLLDLNSHESSDFYAELILVLDLYTEGIVNRMEAIRMVEPLF